MSSLDTVQAMLGKEVRVVLDDGRVIEGSLQCLDKDLNFIIGEASEYHGVTDALNVDPEVVVTRKIGCAMIPGKHVTNVLAHS